MKYNNCRRVDGRIIFIVIGYPVKGSEDRVAAGPLYPENATSGYIAVYGPSGYRFLTFNLG